jgi:hypothetical protein
MCTCNQLFLRLALSPLDNILLDLQRLALRLLYVCLSTRALRNMLIL